MIEKVKREGFVRVRVDGEILELGQPEPIRLKKTGRHTIEAVVDRLVVRDGIRTRLADSVETALKWGGNRLVGLKANAERPTPNAERRMGSGAVFDRLREPGHELLVRRTDAETLFV